MSTTTAAGTTTMPLTTGAIGTSSTGGAESTSSAGPTTDTSPGTSTSTGGSTTGGVGSTGAAADFALYFSGNGIAQSQQNVAFSPQDFTVELWTNLLAESARGSLVNLMNDDFTAGWNFGILGNPQDLVFGYWTSDGVNHVIVTGPAVQDIGTGWHHLAVSKSGTLFTMFIDGVPAVQQAVPQQGPSSVIPLQVGDQPNTLGGAWRLQDAVVDDVRISNAALWTAQFVPQSSFAVLPSTAVLLRFDEGSGTITTDVEGMAFDISGAQWTQGYP